MTNAVVRNVMLTVMKRVIGVIMIELIMTTDYGLRTTDYRLRTGSGLLPGVVFEFFSFELDGVSEVFGVAEELFGVGGEEVLLDVGRDGFSVSADAPCMLFEYAEESVFFIFSMFFKVVET